MPAADAIDATDQSAATLLWKLRMARASFGSARPASQLASARAIFGEIGPQGLNQKDIGKSINDHILAGCASTRFKAKKLQRSP